ncbi:MAG: type II toxin-antitoxin system HicB family antitoxin [Gammaproteobacteria bacterium]|uniref:HicB protein n=1 Tax=endosymbiont of Bathymodiolus septemdierum str. Myojin knoll TaxID=1303921 RepID=A0A0P0USU2_9GAMM|nr:type II toxin-antitoxin system HicB family antitoxin [Bathymodiolus septemdierum thioautotrophic gill symbiont]RUA04525.1 MAG: type II toxin-antitoxin system HicB family antitoxin [Gammaproteobacteria bacterium]BAS67968.1 HicB protein [endosymbiont of Bathymodiolus septemdierum str. Myojin knoll]
MEYKGYKAQVNFSEEDQIFWGEVINIGKNKILFESDNAKKIYDEFKASVDFYLETCKKNNNQVVKPASGKFSLRIDPKEHAQLTQVARQRKMSVNALVRNFITDRLRSYQ